jgi:hypothetical protein
MGWLDYWIASMVVKLSMIVGVFVTSTKMVGISYLFSKLFQFGGGAHLNFLCMLTWRVILFNNNQQSMKFNVTFLGCCVKVLQQRCPCKPNDFTRFWVNSLVQWTRTSELHPHFVVVRVDLCYHCRIKWVEWGWIN